MPGKALTPFAPEIVEFWQALSRALFADERCRRMPDIQALAFRMRRAELARMEADFRRSIPECVVRRPRGLVFHIAPANVDTMFLYSWMYSGLMGNRNLIRVSAGASELSLLLCDIVAGALANAPEPIRHSAAVIQYGHDDAVTAAVSAACNARVIWGGDETVRAIRSIPLAPRATEIVFADRYSFSIVASQPYLALSPGERVQLADQFFNDTFWFDQMACSSPRLVVWAGPEDEGRQASREFLDELERAVVRKHYAAETGTRLNRLTFACRAALDGPVTAIERHGGQFEALWLSELTDFCREHCGGGLLFQYASETLEDVARFVTSRDQTVTYFGLEGEQIRAFSEQAGSRGVDHIVPIGQALQFDRYWDGYDLFLELTRQVRVI